MNHKSWLIIFIRCLHMLSVCSWLGGGLGVLLLLYLDQQTDSIANLSVYNQVIIRIDDILITCGAAGTLVSGLFLAWLNQLTIKRRCWLAGKLLATLLAICFGILFLAPWLQNLYSFSCHDGLAIFDDRRYEHSFNAGVMGCIGQSLVLMALLTISVIHNGISRKQRSCGGCKMNQHQTRG